LVYNANQVIFVLFFLFCPDSYRDAVVRSGSRAVFFYCRAVVRSCSRAVFFYCLAVVRSFTYY